MTRGRSGLTFEAATALALRLPGVEVTTSYGTQALKVRGKLIARVWEDGRTLVLRMPIVVHDHLMIQVPTKYFLSRWRPQSTMLRDSVAVTPSSRAVVGGGRRNSAERTSDVRRPDCLSVLRA